MRAARTESRIYLADTVVQFAFAVVWIRPWGAPHSEGADWCPRRRSTLGHDFAAEALPPPAAALTATREKFQLAS